jgi:hypothetical protein
LDGKDNLGSANTQTDRTPAHRPPDTTQAARPNRPVRQAAHSDAVIIVQQHSRITGPQLRIELQKQGWTLSDRTARRILTDAAHATRPEI